MEFLPEILIAVVGLIATAVGVRSWQLAKSRKRFYAAVLQTEDRTWQALRNEPLRAAEEAAAQMLHSMGDGSHLPPWIYASMLYTHGCLLVEEDSLKFAAERFSSANQIAKSRYGAGSLYSVPPAIALAWLHFRSNSFEKAAKLLANGLRIYEAKLGKDHPRTVRVKAMLALVAFAVGFTKESEQQLREAAGSISPDGADHKVISDALGLVSYYARLR